MSHDVEAAWAGAELAQLFKGQPDRCYAEPVPAPDEVSPFASPDVISEWPNADGAVTIVRPKGTDSVAVEYKRREEGVHGILTAIGQGFGYLQKGYGGVALVIPREYSGFDDAGRYVASLLSNVGSEPPIGVFTYQAPNVSATSPFSGLIVCVRPVGLDVTKKSAKSVKKLYRRARTQWAHMREGSSFRDYLYRYLCTAKMPIEDLGEPKVSIPTELEQAVTRINAKVPATKYLSYTSDDSRSSLTWRHFWFNWVAWDDVLHIWKPGAGPPYIVQSVPTRLRRDDGKESYIFATRSDSPKQMLVNKLNDGKLAPDRAWETFARKLHSRAHSLREDVDSGLAHLGMLAPDFRPTDLGYRFVDLCERSGDPTTGAPASLIGAALLQHGQYGALLHYLHRLSEDVFSETPRRFVRRVGGREKFNQDAYRRHMEAQLANQLRVLRKSRERGGQARKPLQAEITFLKRYGFVTGFRIGLGLQIDWVKVQDAMSLPL
jgi:hypothetical protein